MDLDKTCRSIAKELGYDYELVRRIVMYEFEYTTKVMKDPNDYREILFNKLFKFKLKTRFKEDKTKNYSPNGRNENNNASKDRLYA